jgi:hypothetical protein
LTDESGRKVDFSWIFHLVLQHGYRQMAPTKKHMGGLGIRRIPATFAQRAGHNLGASEHV